MSIYWSNSYWGSFKQIEKRIIELTHFIYFDDKQMDVYSAELSDLLLSICSKIESVAKDLYEDHVYPFLLDDGKIPSTNPKITAAKLTNWGRDKWRYDYDCIRELNSFLKLSDKQIMIDTHFFHIKQFSDTIVPFGNIGNNSIAKSFAGGKWEIILNNERSLDNPIYESIDWAKAYQYVKHDYKEGISLYGNIKNVLVALGALFILLIYLEFYKKKRYIGVDPDFKFTNDMGSEIFSVYVNNASRPVFIVDSNSDHFKSMSQDSNEVFVINSIMNEKKYNDLKNKFIEYKLSKNDNGVFFDISNVVKFNGEIKEDVLKEDLNFFREIERKLYGYSGSNVLILNENRVDPYSWYDFSPLEYERKKHSIEKIKH